MNLFKSYWFDFHRSLTSKTLSAINQKLQNFSDKVIQSNFFHLIMSKFEPINSTDDVHFSVNNQFTIFHEWNPSKEKPSGTPHPKSHLFQCEKDCWMEIHSIYVTSMKIIIKLMMEEVFILSSHIQWQQKVFFFMSFTDSNNHQHEIKSFYVKIFFSLSPQLNEQTIFHFFIMR